MKHSNRRHELAKLALVVVAAFAAACGQVGTNEQTQAAGGMRAASPTRSWLTEAEVCNDGEPCTPTGAHGAHGGFTCTTCHKVGGVLGFDPNGAAYGAGQPPPSFDATAKTCSNVACHGVPAGTYSYYFPGNEDNDGDGYPDRELKTVNYGGTLAGTTPGWYATGAGCAACHGNPPANGSDGSNAWHSGMHAGNTNFNVGGVTLNSNQCELCHNEQVAVPGVFNPVFYPIAQSARAGGTGPYQGVLILRPNAHGNGLNVAARFDTACFACH